MKAWTAMLAELWEWGAKPIPLAEWLQAAEPGEILLVQCDTAPEKGNVQSRVNRIVKTRGLRATAVRCRDGVIVEKLK